MVSSLDNGNGPVVALFHINMALCRIKTGIFFQIGPKGFIARSNINRVLLVFNQAAVKRQYNANDAAVLRGK